MNISGKVKWKHSRGGVLLKEGSGENLIVDGGLALTAQFWDKNLAPAEVEWVGLGDDATVPGEVQTDLISPLAIARTLASTQQSGVNFIFMQFTVSNLVLGNIVREIGLFNALTSGTMVARFLIQELTAQTGDSLQIDWTLEFGR